MATSPFQLYPYQREWLRVLERGSIPMLCFMPRLPGKSYLAAIARQIEAEKKAAFALASQRQVALQWVMPRYGKSHQPTQQFKHRAKWHRKG